MPIPGYGGYWVNKSGRILSFRKKRPAVLSPTAAAGRYKRVCLRPERGVAKMACVHRLVLLTFVGPLPKGQQTRHLNGNSFDNRLSNLRYGTPKENVADQKKHGRFIEGERHKFAKLTVRAVREIRCKHKWGDPKLGAYGLAREYGVSHTTVQRILGGISWQSVK